MIHISYNWKAEWYLMFERYKTCFFQYKSLRKQICQSFFELKQKKSKSEKLETTNAKRNNSRQSNFKFGLERSQKTSTMWVLCKPQKHRLPDYSLPPTHSSSSSTESTPRPPSNQCISSTLALSTFRLHRPRKITQ